MGNKFGKLTIIERIKDNNGNIKWKCKCDCGNETAGRTWEIRTGRKHSCGCDDITSFKDLTNKRFGKLVVISFGKIKTTKSGHKKYFWKCKCDCGNETLVSRGHLKNKKIQSCGCECYRIGEKFNHFNNYEEIPREFFRRLNYRVRKNKIYVDVSPKYLWNLFLKQNKKCALSGLPVGFYGTNYENPKSKTKYTASLDRIDSSKGYIEGNVQWVHKQINFMKQSMKQEDFIKMCELVVNNRNVSISSHFSHTNQNQEVFPS